MTEPAPTTNAESEAQPKLRQVGNYHTSIDKIDYKPRLAGPERDGHWWNCRPGCQIVPVWVKEGTE